MTKTRNTYLTLTVVLLSPMAANADLINDGSFESTTSPQVVETTWDASVYGSWAVGDPLTTVGTTHGILPLDGAKMLAFSGTSGSSQDLYQIIDLTSYAASIDAGLITADISVYFNALGSTTAGLRLLGWTSAPLSFSGHYVLGGSLSNALVDSNLETWQQFSVNSIAIAAGTRYVAFGMHSQTVGPILYADSASMMVNEVAVPEPGTLALLGLGLVVMAARRRKTV